MTATINNQALTIVEYKGIRVVTFADIDRVHERTNGTASRAFRANRERFIEGEDYFNIGKNQSDEIRHLEIPNRGIIVLTEFGYLLLVKSLTDKLAWKVQRQLVKGYFRAKSQHQQLTTGNPLLDESYYHLQESTKFNTECLHEHEHRIIDVETMIETHTEKIAECKQDIDELKQASSSRLSYRQITEDCMTVFGMETHEFRRWAKKAIITISGKENIHTNSVYCDLYNDMDKDGGITSLRNEIKRDADWLYHLVKVNGKWQRREKRIRNLFDAITMYHLVLPNVPRTYRDTFAKLILDRLAA